MTTYERVKSATAGPVTDTHFWTENAMFIFFVLESEKKNRHNIETAVVIYILSFFIWIPNVNWFLGQFIPQFINV